MVLNDFGFKLRKGKGSHTVYEHSTEDISLVVAAHKTHIPVYIVKKALEAIDQIIKQGVSEEIENNEEND